MSKVDVRIVDGVTVATINTKLISSDDAVHIISKEVKEILNGCETRKVLLNLERVEMMPSLMIGELIMLKKHFEANKAQLRLCNLRPMIAESLNISGLCDLFEIDEDEQTGLQNLQSDS